MADYVNTTDLRLARSRDPSKLPAGSWQEITRAEYDSALAIPIYYREWNGSAVVEADAGTKATVDAARLAAARDVAAAQLQQQEDILRAFMLVVLDELNRHQQDTQEILDAAADATSLGDFKARMGAITPVPVRDEADLRAAIRNKLGM